jgi:iron(III) transport system ATP-binding protein
MPCLLKIENLYKSYSKQEGFAVKNISFDVEEGEILALVGESGSGKTTLLRLLAGLEHPDSGTIWLGGKKILDGQMSLRPHKRKIGLVFQDYALFPHLSIIDNVMFGVEGNYKDRLSRAKQVLELVNIKENEKKYPHQLSGGQQQRIALARAIAPQPKILLMDEPFSNLDAMLKDQVREEIRQIIKKTGVTSIFVTHDTRDALSTADRIAILYKGSLQQIDHPRNLYDHPVTPYVANFFGKLNRIQGTPTKEGFFTTFGMILDPTAHLYSGDVHIIFRPEHASLCNQTGQSLIGQVLKVAYFGDHQLVKLADGKGQFVNIKANPNQDYSAFTHQCFALHKYEIASICSDELVID